MLDLPAAAPSSLPPRHVIQVTADLGWRGIIRVSKRGEDEMSCSLAISILLDHDASAISMPCQTSIAP